MAERSLWLAIYFGVLLWSGLASKDGFTWLLEVFPALVGFVLILATFRRFPLTLMMYWLVLMHCVILMIGGHYTYAEVPWFDWLRDALHWQRNNYDKLGHFAQGFIPAILAREILLWLGVVRGCGWLNFIIICVCLALSASYELVELGVALASGDNAVAFLATQGDPWDTQSDMGFALLGAILALTLLSKWHDLQLARLNAAAQAEKMLSSKKFKT